MNSIKIKTKTETGVPVEIFFADGKNNTVIKAVSQHPQLGKISGSGDWGSRQGREGFVITHVKINGKYSDVCMTIPKEDYAPIAKELENRKAARKEAELKKEAENRKKALAECPEGYVIARCLWTNGDLMSGEYQTEDGTKVIGPDMLENHHGWFFIEKSSVEEKKEQEEKKEIKRVEDEKKENIRVEKIFKTAKETGEKQVLRTFPIDCTDHREECITDIVTVWAMPDGTKTETVSHTW